MSGNGHGLVSLRPSYAAAMSGAAQAERQELAALLDQLGPDAPTLCAGWSTADLAAHLVIRERRPDAAAGIVLGPLADYTAKVQDQVRQSTPYPRLVERVRSGPPAVLRPFDDALNTAEYFVHHEDVRRAREPWTPRTLDDAETKLLWSRLGLLGRQLARRAPVGVELIAPGLGKKLVKGGDQVVSVTGDPGELLLWAFGRAGAALVELSGDSESVEALRATKLGF
jgi:uncharacterized protein (TIGR03085 family)